MRDETRSQSTTGCYRERQGKECQAGFPRSKAENSLQVKGAEEEDATHHGRSGEEHRVARDKRANSPDRGRGDRLLGASLDETEGGQKRKGDDQRRDRLSRPPALVSAGS